MQGVGRIELFDRNIQGANIRAIEGAKLVRCDLSHVNISMFDDVEFEDCILDWAVLTDSAWDRAMLVGCSFRDGYLGLIHFFDATITGGDFARAYAERSSWHRAIVTSVSFQDANLRDGRFDDAVFARCDFRNADLSCHIVDGDFARCPNTYFIDCDFRGANLTGLRLNDTTFERCRFHGVIGAPVLEGPVTIIDADFSEAGEGSDLRSQAVVMAMWEP